MSRVSWQWQEDRVVVIPAGGGMPAMFELLADRTLEDAEGFSSILDEAVDVHQALMGADRAFRTGWADYTDAAQNFRSLRRELPKAAGLVRNVAVGVGRFFSPGLVEAFAGDAELLAAFAVEAVPKLAMIPAPASTEAAAPTKADRKKGRSS